MTGSDGWQLNGMVYDAIRKRNRHADDMRYLCYEKECFGSFNLACDLCTRFDYIEVIGLCTDVCVISNAVLLRNFNECVEVVVDASCCAGVTPEKHRIALEAMKSCGIHVVSDEM